MLLQLAGPTKWPRNRENLTDLTAGTYIKPSVEISPDFISGSCRRSSFSMAW